jgi:hypothetical protein
MSVSESIFSVDDFTLTFEDDLTDFESALATDSLDGESLEPSGDFKDPEVDLFSLSPSS